MKILVGMGIYPALAIGQATIYKKLSIEELAKMVDDRGLGINDFKKAVEETRRELNSLYEKLEKGNKQLAEIIEFQTLLLDDEEFVGNGCKWKLR